MSGTTQTTYTGASYSGTGAFPICCPVRRQNDFVIDPVKQKKKKPPGNMDKFTGKNKALRCRY